MAKQDNTNRGAIPLSDTRLYKVSLVVALNDYTEGGVPSFTALDAIVPFIADDVTVLSMEEHELLVIPAETQVAEALPAVKAVNTVPADTELVEEIQAVVAQPKPVKKAKKRNKRKSRARNQSVIDRREDVFAVLEVIKAGTADEIALLAKYPVKVVYNSLYELHNAKRIAAHKQHGKVEWRSLSYTAPTTNETK